MVRIQGGGCPSSAPETGDEVKVWFLTKVIPHRRHIAGLRMSLEYMIPVHGEEILGRPVHSRCCIFI